jgi:lipopolysaccharide exporter
MVKTSGMLRQKVLLGSSSKVVSHTLQLAGTIAVARLAGADVLGTVAFALSYVSILTFISDMGLGTAFIRLASLQENEEKDILATFARLKIGFVALFVVTILSMLGSQLFIFDVSFETEAHIWVILFTLVSIAIIELYRIPRAVFNYNIEQSKKDIPDVSHKIIFQVLRIGVVLAGFGAIAIAISKIVAAIAILPLYLFFSKNLQFGKFSGKIARDMLLTALPITVVVTGQVLTKWSDKLILNYFTNAETLGFYTAAFGMVSFVGIIQSSIGSIFFPLFARNIQAKAFDYVNDILARYFKFLFAIVFPFFVLIYLFATPLVSLLLGPGFAESANVLQLSLFAVFVPLVFLPYANILFGNGQFRLSAIVWILHFLSILLLGYLFVNPAYLNMQGVGMALAILLAKTIMLFIFAFYSMETIGSKSLVFLFKIAIISLAIFSGTIVANSYFSNGIITSLIIAICYLALVILATWFFRLITKKDMAYFVDAFNLGKMKRYISAEIRDQ